MRVIYFLGIIFFLGLFLYVSLRYTTHQASLSDSLNYVDISLTDSGVNQLQKWGEGDVEILIKPIDSIELTQEYFIETDSLGIAPVTAVRGLGEKGDLKIIEIYVAKTGAAIELDNDYVLSQLLSLQIYLAISIYKNQIHPSQGEQIAFYGDQFRKEYDGNDFIGVSKVSP